MRHIYEGIMTFIKKKKRDRVTLTDIPDDVIQAHIFIHLDWASIEAIKNVCKDLNRVVSEYSTSNMINNQQERIEWMLYNNAILPLGIIGQFSQTSPKDIRLQHYYRNREKGQYVGPLLCWGNSIYSYETSKKNKFLMHLWACTNTNYIANMISIETLIYCRQTTFHNMTKPLYISSMQINYTPDMIFSKEQLSTPFKKPVYIYNIYGFENYIDGILKAHHLSRRDIIEALSNFNSILVDIANERGEKCSKEVNLYEHIHANTFAGGVWSIFDRFFRQQNITVINSPLGKV